MTEQPSFADYTRHLNTAAGDATRRLVSRHDVEYEEYLEERMNMFGYVRNPNREPGNNRTWIVKDN